MKAKTSITKEQYDFLDTAYNSFNKSLFDNQLPDVMIVLSRKSQKNFGYFHAGQYQERDVNSKKKAIIRKYDELALNPDKFFSHPDIELLQTLAHEMCHAWRYHCTERQPRAGYHDKVWGKKMEDIGLMPSDTGAEGGKKTGQQMMEYVIAGGKFDKLAHDFLKKHPVKYGSHPVISLKGASDKSKIKYICPSCDMKVWGKPDLNINCGDCNERLEEE